MPVALDLFRAEVHPVEILIERDHRFKKKPARRDKKKDKTVQPPGCATCGEAKDHPYHLGSPPSMNNHSIAFNRMAFAGVKSTWQHVVAEKVQASGLPRGLQAIYVECVIGFDEYRECDEGNHRWMPEKAGGDALVNGWGYSIKTGTDDKGKTIKEWVQVIEGGWLKSDSFFPARRFSVGNLEGVHTPGESWTRMRIFPSMDPPTVSPRNDR